MMSTTSFYMHMMIRCLNCRKVHLLSFGDCFSSKRLLSSARVCGSGGRTMLRSTLPLGRCSRSYSDVCTLNQMLFAFTRPLWRPHCNVLRRETLLQGGATSSAVALSTVPLSRQKVTDTPLSSATQTFVVMKFDQEGNVTSFEKKKTELYQELSLQARDLRFQHSTSLTARHNCIVIRMETLKAIVTPESLLVLDFRGLGLERWLVLELAPQLASPTHTLPFEFRALEAILQYRVNTLQRQLNEVHPVILDTLESLVDPKILSADRSKLHVLLQNSKSLSELETDIKVFKDSLLKILDEDEIIEELCLTKWMDPRVFEESGLGIDHAEEMELLLENYYMQAEELANMTRELKGLIDDAESVIFINLDRYLHTHTYITRL
ncbi:magnesium transporter MRS2 homolog, mitochondrial isoform X2 [Thalassophryne amazonica]|uniref:magnesium transporter MRS2 homolog, mitochondrial isoform X2 n=1 Tax=Thalassophryne amazonica TaxID=390379 RepID=UPI0014715FCA|nr:magnesium transporter MRS2 homolog, mitochondrial isoform X2 [Thalassophryne amazonica]XP_034031095.1 magnesium transporter MRS2 homolog, mitochondrial isoform X2 [Thalassophryne amazonica]